MKLSKRILAVLLAGTMALALLAGCGSSVGSKDVDVINVMLQLNGSDVKVTEDASLKADADRFVSLLQKLVPFEAGPDEESTVREENYKVTDQQDEDFPWSNKLNSTLVAGKSKRLVLVSDDPQANNDARRANEIAWRIKELNDQGLKVKGIAVVKTDDGRRTKWESGELVKVEKTSVWVAVVTYE